MRPQEAVLYLPREKLINANHRAHWTKRNVLTRTIRNIAHWNGLAMKPATVRSRVVITYGWTGPGRVRDAGNLQPTSKALVDGLVDAGVFPDDNDAWVEGPDNRFGEKSDRPGLVKITIRIEAAS